jgi:HEAT repeat protein
MASHDHLPNLAIWILVCLNAQDDVGTLVDRLHAESVEEREKAGRALAARGESARAAVEKAAKDPDPEVAQRAAQILHRLDFRKTVPPRLKTVFPGIEERLESGNDRAWTQAFLEALGYRLQGDELRLPDSLEPGDLDFLVVRALRGAAAIPETGIPPGAGIADPPAKENPVLRAAGRFNLRAAIPEMVALLGHPDPTFSSHFIEDELSELDALEGIPALVVRLSEDKWDVSVRILKRLGAVEASPLLVPLLRSTRSTVRARAADALGTCGSPEAVAALLPLLKDPDDGVCLSVASALGALGAKEALPALVDLAGNPTRKVQGAAARVLSRLGLKDAVPALLKATERLSNEDDRPDLILALGELGAREAAPLLRRLIGDRDYNFRERALHLLVQLEARDAAPEIVASLKDPEISVRLEAILAMERLRLAEHAEALVPLLKDERLDMQVSAALALAKFGTKSALAYFVSFLSDVNIDADDQSMVAFILGREGIRDATPILQKIVRDGPSDEKPRISAARALADLGATEAIPDLRMMIVGRGEELRAAGAAALGRLNAREAIPDLLKALGDPESGPRAKRSAALALGGMKAEAAAPLLRQALAGQEIPGSAALALAEMGSREAIPGILKLLENKDLRVCSQAADALSRLDPGAATRLLKERLEGRSRSVRAAAAVALCRLGAREGVATFLEVARFDTSIPLCSLNAVRSPGIWARLRDGRRPYAFYALPNDRGEGILVFPAPQANAPRGTEMRGWVPGENQGWDSPLSMLEGNEFSFILEEDRVRLPDRCQARRIWREWWRKQGRTLPLEK